MDFYCIILNEEDYRKKYEKAFKAPKFSEDFTEKHLSKEFELFDSLLKEKLNQHWPQNSLDDDLWSEDFELNGDDTGTFYHCGGIYSKKLFAKKYVDTIVDVMTKLPHSEDWFFHTTVEYIDDTKEKVPFTEFFIKSGKVYSYKDVPDNLFCTILQKTFGKLK
ncbi:MAG: hypothetical protein GY750_00975 [Lentisphaerae bacterium]|nr:hypothetical protein [Lentisphaerota bacterium]MCP4099990.1 hypothetical protein [Lentisphaerota bacterium]